MVLWCIDLEVREVGHDTLLPIVYSTLSVCCGHFLTSGETRMTLKEAATKLLKNLCDRDSEICKMHLIIISSD